MPRGYTRVRLAGCGAGAGEVWSALLDAHDRRPGGPWDVGSVRRVFDRSAYLGFDAGALGGVDRLGPPLVLLAGGGFDGPLATRVETDGSGGFRPDRMAAGDACRLRRSAGGDGVGRFVLAVGDTTDLVVDRSSVAAPDAGRAAAADLATMSPQTAVYRRAETALELLAGTDPEDGLGWLDDVMALADGAAPSGDLGALVEGWVSLLRDSEASTEPPPTAVLGRGPGATPAGDDVLSGLLLALVRSTSGERHRRVREAGEAVVAAAADGTTSVSTALIAQAVQGRADGRVDAAVEAILGADEPAPGWESAVRSAAAVGHTSGVDLLLGVLLVPLAIGPAIEPPR